MRFALLSSWATCVLFAFLCVLPGVASAQGEPTATPTNAPTMVLVPATPTVTPAPAATTEAEYLADIRTYQRSSFIWQIFAGVLGVGVLILLFMRVQV